MMFFRLLFRKLNRLLQEAVPPGLYVAAARIGYPLFDPKRRGSGVKIRKVDGLYRAVSASRDIYFDSPFKVGRYLYKDESDSIEAYLLDKYSSRSVRVEKGDIVIDVGANVGEFSRAVVADASLVLSIEPDPSPYRCLVKNTQSHETVRTYNVGLGESDGEMEMFLSPARNNSSVIEPIEGWAKRATIPVLTLETLIREAGLDRVDFLKLEAEGYEPEILAGAGTMLSSIAKVAIDAAPERRGEPTNAECEEILRAHGFEVWREGWMVYGTNREVGETPIS